MSVEPPEVARANGVGHRILRIHRDVELHVSNKYEIDARSVNRLGEILLADEWFVLVLEAVRSVFGDAAYITAGAIRDVVWDHLSGLLEHDSVDDVDVVFFDPSDASQERDRQYERELASKLSDEKWEVTNQAGVHNWYHLRFGERIRPYSSLEDAVSTYPEYAVCVAVRLTSDGGLDVVAPHGLEDLFDMKVRRNPAQVTEAEFGNRLERKDNYARWPKVEIDS